MHITLNSAINIRYGTTCPDILYFAITVVFDTSEQAEKIIAQSEATESTGAQTNLK